MKPQYVIVDLYSDGRDIEIFEDQPGLGVAIAAFRRHDKAFVTGKLKLDGSYVQFQPFMQARGFEPLSIRRRFSL